MDVPILIFTYKRLLPLMQVIETLKKNKLSIAYDLYIYSDGPKKSIDDIEVTKINEVREYCSTINGFRSIQLIKQKKNLGLKNSIKNGVTEVLKKYSSAIIIEDDVHITEDFLDFMHNALLCFQNSTNVWGIGSFTFFNEENKINSNFLHRYPDTKAWAIYKSAWDKIDFNAESLINQLSSKRLWSRFNCDDAFNYRRMLIKEKYSKIDSWSIYLTASAILKSGLFYFPAKPLSLDIGFDMDATHTKGVKFHINPANNSNYFEPSYINSNTENYFALNCRRKYLIKKFPFNYLRLKVTNFIISILNFRTIEWLELLGK